MNTLIATWSLSGTRDEIWRIHSSLVLPEDYSVTSLDIKCGNLNFRQQKEKSDLNQDYLLLVANTVFLCIR